MFHVFFLKTKPYGWPTGLKRVVYVMQTYFGCINETAPRFLSKTENRMQYFKNVNWVELRGIKFKSFLIKYSALKELNL